ncbi:MAG: 2-C-methyl-D-erythritol 2,4-cyclodiphosphate synthase [Armatimonadetes bacterium]|nr:2-C-methyl-D-erythritol 2,4-cyclodiphosphate synthase [Armatimonadota bacterium]
MILPAAGSGQRVGAPVNKLLLPLRAEPLLLHTLRAVARVGAAQVVLVCRDDERPTMAALAASAELSVTFAVGGATRQESVANGLAALAPEIDIVAVHDAARPMVTPELFWAALASAAERGTGVVALPAVDTLKLVEGTLVVSTLDRSRVWAVQTPQAVRVTLLREGYRQAADSGLAVTDEAGLVEALGQPVHLVEGSARNIKVTRAEDFAVAEALLQGTIEKGLMTVWPRVGYGYDVHRLTKGRELWLGGVRIDSPLGLLGHSDADALLHAICDAMLGAVGLGDIGRHFPDTDPAYEGIASIKLLSHVAALLHDKGWQVHNLDATVVAEKPKLAPHVPAMVACIAEAVGIDEGMVNIKATTNEKLDDLGAQLGICAHAVALVVPR